MFEPLVDDFVHAFDMPSKWVTLRKIEILWGAIWKLAISHMNLAFQAILAFECAQPIQ
jgi:hypothetical protein